MSYLVQAQLTKDSALMERATACAALEGEKAPDAWVYSNRWALSAQPGWVAAYASAIASGGSALPGANEAAVTDGMILSAVQNLRSPAE